VNVLEFFPSLPGRRRAAAYAAARIECGFPEIVNFESVKASRHEKYSPRVSARLRSNEKPLKRENRCRAALWLEEKNLKV
jgi:hypothetical protein